MCPIAKPDTQEAIAAIAREIQHYLEDHPCAADTAEGIQGWWLCRQRYQEALDRVQRALDRLEANGTVVKSVLPGGNVIYSLRTSGLRNPH
jgi:hypothetical protein